MIPLPLFAFRSGPFLPSPNDPPFLPRSSLSLLPCLPYASHARVQAGVDALFDNLDLDGGGDLDLEELSAGLEILLETAAKATGQQEALQEMLDSYNERAALYDQAAIATEAAEAVEVEIRALVDNPSIQLRAGKQLIKYTKDSQLSEYAPAVVGMPQHL